MIFVSIKMYAEKTIAVARERKHEGVIDSPDAVAEVGGICGDKVKFYLKIENEIIKEVKYETPGCMAAVASCSTLAEVAKGKTLDEALAITPKSLIEGLGLPGIKNHCAQMAVVALKNAVGNYRKK